MKTGTFTLADIAATPNLSLSAKQVILQKRRACFAWLSAWLEKDAKNGPNGSLWLAVERWAHLMDPDSPGPKDLEKILDTIRNRIEDWPAQKDDLQVIFDALCEQTGVA